ncbi:hypothetical protein AAHE18_10G187700 [Arachis hypogaea]
MFFFFTKSLCLSLNTHVAHLLFCFQCFFLDFNADEHSQRESAFMSSLSIVSSGGFTLYGNISQLFIHSPALYTFPFVSTDV